MQMIGTATTTAIPSTRSSIDLLIYGTHVWRGASSGGHSLERREQVCKGRPEIEGQLDQWRCGLSARGREPSI